jgi:predicted HTH transcriptional regulator
MKREKQNKKITDIFTDIITDKLSKTELEFLEQIAGYIDKNGEITNYRAQLLTNKSNVSVKKYLARFAELGILSVEGKNKGRKYVIRKACDKCIHQLTGKTLCLGFNLR